MGGGASSTSGQTFKGASRMDVVCVLDVSHGSGQEERRKALLDIKHACNLVGAEFHHITVRTENLKETRITP